MLGLTRMNSVPLIQYNNLAFECQMKSYKQLKYVNTLTARFIFPSAKFIWNNMSVLIRKLNVGNFK